MVAGSRRASADLGDLVEAGQVHEVQVDLSAADGPTALVAAAREHGPIGILVNNVGGVTPRLSGFLDVTDEQWLGSLNLTFMAAVRTTRAALEFRGNQPEQARAWREQVVLLRRAFSEVAGSDNWGLLLEYSLRRLGRLLLPGR